METQIKTNAIILYWKHFRARKHIQTQLIENCTSSFDHSIVCIKRTQISFVCIFGGPIDFGRCYDGHNATEMFNRQFAESNFHQHHGKPNLIIILHSINVICRLVNSTDKCKHSLSQSSSQKCLPFTTPGCKNIRIHKMPNAHFDIVEGHSSVQKIEISNEQIKWQSIESGVNKNKNGLLRGGNTYQDMSHLFFIALYKIKKKSRVKQRKKERNCVYACEKPLFEQRKFKFKRIQVIIIEMMKLQ